MHNRAPDTYPTTVIHPPERLHDRGFKLPAMMASHPAIKADNVTLVDDASARRVLATRRAIERGELDTDLVMEITADKVLDQIVRRDIDEKYRDSAAYRDESLDGHE